MFSLAAFWRARKSSQHHKTFQINSSLACQNAFPLPSTPARDYRDLLWNGLIVQGIKDFYGSISGCALNCEFPIQTAQGPWPWAPSVAEALCCFTHLKLADMFKFAVPLLNLFVIALWKPCKAKWLKTYMCQGNEVLPSLILVCISRTAIYAHFDEIYGTYRRAVRHISMWHGNLREDIWQIVNHSVSVSHGAVIP